MQPVGDQIAILLRRLVSRNWRSAACVPEAEATDRIDQGLEIECEPFPLTRPSTCRRHRATCVQELFHVDNGQPSIMRGTLRF